MPSRCVRSRMAAKAEELTPFKPTMPFNFCLLAAAPLDEALPLAVLSDIAPQDDQALAKRGVERVALDASDAEWNRRATRSLWGASDSVAASSRKALREARSEVCVREAKSLCEGSEKSLCVREANASELSRCVCEKRSRYVKVATKSLCSRAN